MREGWTASLLSILVLCVLVRTCPGLRPPFLQRQDVSGVWKIQYKDSFMPSVGESRTQELVLQLQKDGSFRLSSSEESPPDSTGFDLAAVLRRGGQWDFRDSELLLAVERPEEQGKEKVFDTLLVGKVEVSSSEQLAGADDRPSAEFDYHLSVGEGQISMGKFMYPRNHVSFWDDNMMCNQMEIGSFHMNQVLGNLNARLQKDREAKKAQPEQLFQEKDFYGRRFYLTSKEFNVIYDNSNAVPYDDSDMTLDVRVTPISFHSNQTFSAEGAGKILRGRFGISGERKDHIWFQVSLFGAGRTAPGSVFSEGPGLSHEDRRGYRGAIQAYDYNGHRAFHVRGKFYAGTDMANQRSPLPMGSFVLQEILEEPSARGGLSEEFLGDEDNGDDGCTSSLANDAFQ